MLAIKYSIDDMEAKTAVKQLTERLSKPQQALKECGLVLLRSISKTFKAGGRPTRWKKSARAKKEEGGKTLIDTARLMRSITMDVAGNKLTVGTDVKYARIHDLGGRIRKNATIKKYWRYMDKAFGKKSPARCVLVRAHQRQMNIDIPARPFLVIQDTDWRVFKRILEDYLTG
jgi:phage virion morphogenesis protein